MVIRKKSNVLVCIPCYNCEAMIREVLELILADSDADILLVDDASERPLQGFIDSLHLTNKDRITVELPEEKQYAGGAKNIGIRRAIELGYKTLVCIDSDIAIRPGFFAQMVGYLENNPQQVVVGAAILPFGVGCQYADTLINFSSYLPKQNEAVSEKSCLASYAFALNTELFRQKPCYMPRQIGGEDVLFFRQIKKNFKLSHLPLLNGAAVLHKHPRSDLRRAFATQRRYARGFFTYNDQQRTKWFNRLPWLHLMTPRFCLMVCRLVRQRRLRDLSMVWLCWLLDFVRSMEVIRLSKTGFKFEFDRLSPDTA